MEGFVDIHTHILPGADDGAQEMTQSLELLKLAYNQGTGAVVLTPHYRRRYRDNDRRKLIPIFEQLCAAAKVECPNLELYLGSEIGYELDVSEKLAESTLLTMNGTHYVLLEFQERSFRSQIIDGVLEVLNFGYTPIIAHVERYEAFRKNFNLADDVAELGALLQLNADSVLGKCGWGIKRYCHKLLKSHRVHFVATDAHNANTRKPDLKSCYHRVRKLYGREYADLLFSSNARVMLKGGDGIKC